MSREQYLQEIWVPYPTMPMAVAQRGLFGSFTELSYSQEIELKPSQKTFKTSFKEMQQILKTEDVVALETKDGKVFAIWLLAPALEAAVTISSNLEIQGQWQKFLRQVVDFFQKQNFLQVQTPIFSATPGTEPFIDLFQTEFRQGQERKKLYALSSPELQMKKLLAQGFDKIFEMRSCFRNGEISETHQPEFMMLEWYRAYDQLETIKQDTKNLLLSLRPELKFSETTMAELFQKYLNFKLTPQTNFEELKNLARKNNLSVDHYTDWDDIFYLLFVEKVEPKIDSSSPLFVCKYPPSQAALARLTEDGWGDRFELYWQGLEIANAFHELNDPQIQEQRFNEDLEKKKTLKKEATPLDLEFLQALKAGMPPSGGIALGLERLFMALYQIKDIRRLKLFPY